MGGTQQDAPDAPARVGGVDEEEEHLAVVWVCSRIAGDLPSSVGRHSNAVRGIWTGSRDHRVPYHVGNSKAACFRQMNRTPSP